MVIDNPHKSELKIKDQAKSESHLFTSSQSNAVKSTMNSVVINSPSLNCSLPTGSTQNDSKKTNTFSKVVSDSRFPKKTQAILIDTVDGLELKMYLKAIATKTLPTNIIAASKISQNRFCCYLNSERLVDELTQEGNNTIEINGLKLKIRPYVTKARRVIFSNVHPCVPHDEIIAILSAKGITPKSNMSFIRLGIDEHGFTQIISFRRQLFIDPDDISKLPSVISIKYDDTLHHIYVSTDKITCFTCNKEGHTAKYCPTSNVSPTPDLDSPIQTNDDTQISYSDSNETSTSQMVNDILDQHVHNEDENNKPLQFNGTDLFKKPSTLDNKTSKRAASASTTTTENSQQNISSSIKPFRPSTKKSKITNTRELPITLHTQLDEALALIPETNKATFPITSDDLYVFIAETYSHTYQEIPNLSVKYSTNKHSIAIMLAEVRNHIHGKTLKTRFTKIINKLCPKSSESTLTGMDVDEDGSATNSESQEE